eukprot:532049-Pleurochrysis_carterae.AAC.1
MSPPGAAGSANGVRPENSRKSPHLSRAVLRRLWSATSRTRAWNALRRLATPSACCSVGWLPSHSSVLVAPSTSVSCNCSARRATLPAAQARSAPAAFSSATSGPSVPAARCESIPAALTASARASERAEQVPPHPPP